MNNTTYYTKQIMLYRCYTLMGKQDQADNLKVRILQEQPKDEHRSILLDLQKADCEAQAKGLERYHRILDIAFIGAGFTMLDEIFEGLLEDTASTLEDNLQ